MDVTLAVHILMGGLGLLSGYVALYAAKGGRLHRKSGMLFVVVMLTMCFLGLLMAVGRDIAPAVNVSAGLLTSYLVITSLTTVRPPAVGGRGLHIGAMSVALLLGVIDLNFGLDTIANGGTRDGIPPFPFFLFGLVGLLGGLGDLRVLRSGPLQGTARLARHLWRMTFALWIATMSFFLGQAKVIPKPIRIPALLALPVLVVLLTLLYWLWRIRIRQSLRGIIRTASVVEPPKTPELVTR